MLLQLVWSCGCFALILVVQLPLACLLLRVLLVHRRRFLMFKLSRNLLFRLDVVDEATVVVNILQFT